MELEKANTHQLAELVTLPVEKTDIKSTINTLMDSCSRIPEASLSSRQLKQAVDETQEIEKRKLNLIIAGLPEGNSSSDLDDFIHHVTLSGGSLASDDVISCERLGKPSGRPRLLRVKFHSGQKRRTILIMKSKTDMPALSLPIFVRPDLTMAQQDADKKLRDDLKAAGKDKFMIRRGIIVPRISSSVMQPLSSINGSYNAPLTSSLQNPLITHRPSQTNATVGPMHHNSNQAVASGYQPKTGRNPPPQPTLLSLKPSDTASSSIALPPSSTDNEITSQRVSKSKDI